MLRILSIATIVLLGATTPVPESLAVSPFETRTTAAESGATATPTPSSPTPTPSSPTPGGPSAPPSPGGPSPSSVPSPSASPISTPVPTVEPSSTPDPDASAEPAPEARTLKATALVGAESFATSDDWTLVSGRGTLSSSSDATEGGTSLKMDYDLSGGTFEIGKTRTPADIPSTGLRSLALDVKGDGTFNTLYLRLRDATGEVLLYRVGNINNTEWSTVTVDLSRAPAASTGGNGDQILDGPVSLFRIVVVKNGTQPTTGTARVDNLRVNDSGWTAPASTTGNVVPGKGTADITFQSGSAGDFRLRLIDPTGKTKTFQGTSATAKTERMRWDGKADDGSALAGIVRGVLEYDTTPNGALAAPMTIGSPYLVGAAQRTELETRGSVAAVNSSLTTYDSLARADNDAALMENAYVRYAREEFEWNRIEPRKGYFDWPKFDQAVSVARARNVDIIGKLVYSADWASSAPSGTPSSTARYYPPSDYADFVNYAVATVQRYKDEVKVWEVWNEPNIVQYWKPAPDASAYARLLNATYAAIKKVQPDAVVLTGGLAGWSEGYMNGMLQAGAMNSFDGFGLHTYVEGAPESSMLDTWIASAQSFLARNASSKPIWITETSWSTCTTCSAGQGVSETLQAQFLSRAMLDAVGHGVRGFAWYNLIEFGSSGSRLDNYGLVEQSGRRKPAYAAFAQTAAALAGSVSGGTVAPSTGTTSVVSDLASTTGITTRALGAGATSKLQATTSRVAGSGALALDYNHSASTAEGTSLSMSFPVAGQPSAISMWVYGDNSSSPVYLKVKDARGEFFEGKIGNAGPVGWSRQTLYFDGLNSNYKSYGANVDKKVDYPITVVEAHVFKSTTSKQSGRIILDDITAHYGTSMRGLTLYGRNFVTQAIYRDTASTTRLPVANTTAYTYDRGTLGALSVNDSLAATVTISPLPKFVVSTHLVTPSTVRQGQSVALRLIAGDRTNMTLQITDASGQLVRTLAVNVSYASGARNITWDGKRSDGTTAAAGGYRFRLQANGPDGRSVAWGRPFTIAP